MGPVYKEPTQSQTNVIIRLPSVQNRDQPESRVHTKFFVVHGILWCTDPETEMFVHVTPRDT